MNVHIGLDDTDSPRTGCTTYVAALLIEKFRKKGIRFIDYPNLIRLNPNVPWKTRGNGALCLRITCEEDLFENIKENVLTVVEEYSDLEYEGTDPGIVFWTGDINCELEAFARRAIQGLVTIEEAVRIIRKFGSEAFGFKKSQGIIGGLAAVGERLKGDHTYEFIAYRTPSNRGTPRKVDSPTVVTMDRQMACLTFNNIDKETGRILITPRGPDPILFGIRGESAEAVKQAAQIVHSEEPIERWVVFRTNHGTDAHLKNITSISGVRSYHPVIVRGEVAGDARTIRGGHVLVEIQDKTGKVNCAAYEPTGSLRDIVRALLAGDSVKVFGGVRSPSSELSMTINIEKIFISRLVPAITLQNPLCPCCRKRMTSIGKMKGFECKKCGYHGSDLIKTVGEIGRSIEPGLYVTPPRSQRHLTKPLSRYGLEKNERINDVEKTIPYEEFSSDFVFKC